MGGRSSSSSASSTSNQSIAFDNRLVQGEGAIGVTGGGSLSLSDMRDQSLTVNDSRDQSLTVNDSRDLSTNFNVSDSSSRTTSTSYSDDSNRSVNNSGNTTISNVDPGALRAMERALLTVDTTNKQAFEASTRAAAEAAAAADAAMRSNAESTGKVFDFLGRADASQQSGFAKLLDVGKSMFDSNVKAVQNAQTLTAEAYRTATAEKAGSIDNKTIVMLGMAAAAVLGLMAWKK